MPEVTDLEYSILRNYQRTLSNRLQDPVDRSRRYTISVRAPINQDAWTVLLLRARFNEESKDWIQEYAQDLVWKRYQGFDLLDVSNVTFSGPRLSLDLPELHSVLNYPKSNFKTPEQLLDET